MSNINTNKYLTNEILNILINKIEGYIGVCITTGELEYTKQIDIEYDDDDDAIEELIFILFNNYITGFNFAYLDEDTTDLDRITLIQYCNEFYEDHYGKGSIIDWRDFNDYDKIINNAGYVFVSDNKEWFAKTWNKLNNSTSEYKCLK